MKSYACLLVLAVTLCSVGSFKIFPIAARVPITVSENDESIDGIANTSDVASDVIIDDGVVSLNSTETSKIVEEICKDTTEVSKDKTEILTDTTEISKETEETLTNSSVVSVPIEVFTNPPVVPTELESSKVSDELEIFKLSSENSTNDSETLTTLSDDVVTSDAVVVNDLTNDILTTIAPITDELTTVAPTTTTSTTIAPTTISTTTITTTTTAPTSIASTTESSTIAPTTDSPTTDAPTTDASIMVTPTSVSTTSAGEIAEISSTKDLAISTILAEVTPSSPFLLEPEWNLSTDLLPPKTEIRTYSFDPRYDDWATVPLPYHKILISE